VFKLPIRFVFAEFLTSFPSPKYKGGFAIRTNISSPETAALNQSSHTKYTFYTESATQANAWFAIIKKCCYLTGFAQAYNLITQFATGKNSTVLHSPVSK
jgi:hypothetical protein